MHRVTLLMVFVLTMACKPSLKQLNHSDPKVNPIESKDSCGFPYQVRSAELVKTGLQNYFKLTHKSSYPYPTSNYYDENPVKEQDSFALASQNYLRSKLGEWLYCNNLYITPNSFGITRDSLQDQRSIVFFFLMPGIVSEEPNQWTGKKLEVAYFQFVLDLKDKSGAKMILPKNVPDCGNSPDCMYKVTRDSAIGIAKSNNYISDTTNYSLVTDGINWTMVVYKNGKRPQEKMIINMQTGKFRWEKIIWED